MITLITGAPGAGKTAALVDMLQDLAVGRDLWVYNIPELKIPHRDLLTPNDWMTQCPDGSVVVLDEVQDVWRSRGAGSKVPEDVKALETHRHRGIDFYIITQGPNLIDSNVRALVGRHVHLRDIGVLGRWWYEWPECADQCRTSWKNAPVKKRYKLPKKIFDQYKSSSLHVKPIRSFPKMLLVLLACVLLGIGLVYRGYTSIKAKSEPAKPLVNSQNGQPFEPGQRLAPADETVDFTPRISNRPWTAPAYDPLRVVVSMPIITSAICVNEDCTCYHQASLIEVDSKTCLDWATRRPFNPYVPDEKPLVSNVRAGDSSAPSGSESSISRGVVARPAAS